VFQVTITGGAEHDQVILTAFGFSEEFIRRVAFLDPAVYQKTIVAKELPGVFNESLALIYKLFLENSRLAAFHLLF